MITPARKIPRQFVKQSWLAAGRPGKRATGRLRLLKSHRVPVPSTPMSTGPTTVTLASWWVKAMKSDNSSERPCTTAMTEKNYPAHYNQSEQHRHTPLTTPLGGISD